MSSTRKAKVGSPRRQERYSSSAAFFHVLRGGLVAKRCQMLCEPEDRALAFFVQELSMRTGQRTHPSCVSFPAWPWPSTNPRPESPLQRMARELLDSTPDIPPGSQALEQALTRWCLDPAFDIRASKGGEAVLVGLRGYKARFEHSPGRPVAMTEITRTIWDALDYCLAQGGITLIEGAYRSGKSFSAQAWALRNLGRVRYVSLSSAPDDMAFFREIARALGVGCGASFKTTQLREKICAVLRGQDLALVLDEAQYLWSQTDRPKTPPDRINFLITAASNHGVPVALLAGRNFSRGQRITDRHVEAWGAEQWHGRIRLRKELPDVIEAVDLMAIARTLLPDADEATVMLLAGSAIRARGYLGALESLASRAKFFASRESIPVAFEHVEKAIAEASDNAANVEPATNQAHRYRPLSPELNLAASRHLQQDATLVR